MTQIIKLSGLPYDIKWEPITEMLTIGCEVMPLAQWQRLSDNQLDAIETTDYKSHNFRCMYRELVENLIKANPKPKIKRIVELLGMDTHELQQEAIKAYGCILPFTLEHAVSYLGEKIYDWGYEVGITIGVDNTVNLVLLELTATDTHNAVVCSHTYDRRVFHLRRAKELKKFYLVSYLHIHSIRECNGANNE